MWRTHEATGGIAPQNKWRTYDNLLEATDLTHTLTHMHKSHDLHRLFSRRRNDAHFSVFLFLLSLAVRLLSISGPTGGMVECVRTEISLNTSCLEDG